MIVALDQMLIQCLIVLCPILLSQTLRFDIAIEEDSRKHQYLIGVIYGLAAVLCEGHPLQIGSGMFDFKWIPFLLAMLYGNVRAWSIACLMIFSYTALWAHTPLRAPLASAILLSVVIWLMQKSYNRASRLKKTILGASVILGVYLIFLTLLLILQGTKAIHLTYVIDGVLYVLVMACSILLIENQREVRRIRREVERAEKLNLISELAASVAHEIRNPLTVARGFIQLVSEDLDERRRQYMATVMQELERTDFIISDFLNFSKPQLDRVELVDVKSMIDSVCNIMQPFAMLHGVDLLVEAELSVSIVGDRSKLKQAIMNLVKNSVEAMPDGGQITIRTEVLPEQVRIIIADTGEGMSPEQLQRLGQPFYSTKEKGTGLGLMVTFRLVEAMQGQLHFQSEKEQGTEAVLLFPICDKLPAKPRKLFMRDPETEKSDPFP